MQRGTMCPPIGIYTNTTHGRAICATITTRSDQRHGNRNDEHQRLGTEPRPNPQSAAYGASRAYVMELLTHYTSKYRCCASDVSWAWARGSAD
jgi:hypothetical protein